MPRGLTFSGMGAVLPVSLRLSLFRLAQHLLQTAQMPNSRKSSFRGMVMLTLPWDQYRLLTWAMQQKMFQPQSNFEGMPQPSTGWNADGTPRYDTLSTALSSFQMPQQQVPSLRLILKRGMAAFSVGSARLCRRARPGMREGETPDEYDRRITTNRENIAALDLLFATWETSSTLRRVRLCRCSTTLLP